MNRMKTFGLYALGIIGFFILSIILENALLGNMFKKMEGNITTADNNSEYAIENVSGAASNVNGFINFTVTNNSDEIMRNKYVKIELFNDRGGTAGTQYVEISDLQPGESKDYQVKFKSNNVSDYKLSILGEDELPDTANIINILGWEIDLSDIFGVDLTNASIFGIKLKDLFNWDNIKTTGGNAWNWGLNLAKTVPWWGYAIATGIILWYMPSGFLFGIFPF